jgi:hypothetical protein
MPRADDLHKMRVPVLVGDAPNRVTRDTVLIDGVDAFRVLDRQLKRDEPWVFLRRTTPVPPDEVPFSIPLSWEVDPWGAVYPGGWYRLADCVELGISPRSYDEEADVRH